MKKVVKKSRLLIAMTLGLLLALSLYFMSSILFSNTFLPGVYIADTLVSGKTEAQAAPMIENKVRNYYKTPITFYTDGFKYETTVKDIAKPVNLYEGVSIIWERNGRGRWGKRLLH